MKTVLVEGTRIVINGETETMEQFCMQAAELVLVESDLPVLQRS